ncbi:MAG: heavy-metal-associated domain-containing protein [Aureispira sp.]
MIQQYHIQGMTCNGCLNRVKSTLLELETIEEVTIDLPSGQTVVRQKTDIPIDTLKAVLGDKYNITLEETPPSITREQFIEKNTTEKFSWAVYKPLLLIVLYILGTCIAVQYPFENFSGGLLMRHFMAGFFLVFSFFKMLNLSGFANSYAQYDLVAARWRPWGLIYPFVELALGVLYLTNSFPFYTNWITIVVLGVSTLGVIKSNLDKKKIKCACLGDVFNLPMSTVTIVEDVTMVAMAAFMLF